MFSGSARAEANLVPGSTQVIPQEIKDEYKELSTLMNSGKLPKGAWDKQVQVGQVPDTREGQSMVVIGENIYLYGG